jgi:type I restriction enzyme R subunit
MNKNVFSERDVISKIIVPALLKKGWDIQTQIFEEVSFTNGRIKINSGVPIRGNKKRADIMLFLKPHIPIAIIEVKKDSKSSGTGMQQAIEYGEMLDVPFVYSTNGSEFIEHSFLVKSGKIEQNLKIDQFPSPKELEERFVSGNKFYEESKKDLYFDNFFVESGGKSPRYYQRNAVNRAMKAVIDNKKRILLIMATGTGKTYTAFQIIYKLWKAKIKKRILFLADRNILIDQTMANDFRHFGGKMTKIKNRVVDKSFEVYLALYQGLTGTEDINNIYKSFSKDFFDLIIIDECHRGSVKEDSSWRAVLDYFTNATQIGMTATPKETNKVSNLEYFGDPVYTYSLKQGIDDGFLAPYNVKRIILDSDIYGYRPEKGKLDKFGKLIDDKDYQQKDFDKKIVLENRTKTVAKVISEEFKKNNKRFEKTIFFCVDIEHAERMRMALINENSDIYSRNSKYIMRITGDNDEGKAQLDNFIDPDSEFPVLVTTSKLMTTGIDAQTCKNIVIDSNINSLIEFKQIIGRGTRINEQYDKYYFNIYDFRNVTKLFSDPDFDGEPESVVDDNEPPKVERPGKDNLVPGEKAGKYYIDDEEVSVIGEKVSRFDLNGNLIIESIEEYTKKIVLKVFENEELFWKSWNNYEYKKSFLDILITKGLLVEELKKKYYPEFDMLSVLCNFAYGSKLIKKDNVILNFKESSKTYNSLENSIGQVLLKIYKENDLFDLENLNILQMPYFNEFGTTMEIIRKFGGRDNYLRFIRKFIKDLRGK